MELRARTCGECQQQFYVCRGCDRGLRYCGLICRQAARRMSQKRAHRKHRRSRAGRADHRDLERERRVRQRARVGDQSSGNLTNEANAAVEVLHETESSGAAIAGERGEDPAAGVGGVFQRRAHALAQLVVGVGAADGEAGARCCVCGRPGVVGSGLAGGGQRSAGGKLGGSVRGAGWRPWRRRNGRRC